MNKKYTFDFDWYDLDTILSGLYKQMTYVKSRYYKSKSVAERDVWLDEISHVKYLINVFLNAKTK